MRSAVWVTMLFGWAAGRPFQEMLAYVGAVGVPEAAACLVLVMLAREVRRTQPAHDAAVLLLVRIAAELRAGSTLRAAVIHVADGGEELAEAKVQAQAGRPMPLVLDAVTPALGRYGPISAAALRMASGTGGSVAPVVEQLVTQVMALDEIERERRAAMAPVLLQAAIVGGVPLVTLVAMVLSGRLVGIVAQGPWHAGMVVVGVLLVVVGAGLVGRIAFRSSRW